MSFTKYVAKEDMNHVLANKELVVLAQFDNLVQAGAQLVTVCDVAPGTLSSADEIEPRMRALYPMVIQRFHNLGWGLDEFESISLTLWERCPSSEDDKPEDYYIYRIDLAYLHKDFKDGMVFQFVCDNKKLITENPYTDTDTSLYLYSEDMPQVRNYFEMIPSKEGQDPLSL